MPPATTMLRYQQQQQLQSSLGDLTFGSSTSRRKQPLLKSLLWPKKSKKIPLTSTMNSSYGRFPVTAAAAGAGGGEDQDYYSGSGGSYYYQTFYDEDGVSLRRMWLKSSDLLWRDVNIY